MSKTSPPFEVLYEDNHLLAVNKPAGLPTMGVKQGKPSLLEAAKSYIAKKYNKPGNVYLGVVSRLDAPVTGVLLMARTSKAAARLSEKFRSRNVEKTYWAVVPGDVMPSQATLRHYLRKDERHRRMHVTSQQAEGAIEAILKYQLQQQTTNWALLTIHPLTGRKHQIRVQLAKHGYPIIGDRKYGSSIDFEAGIALHSRRLLVEHPVRRQPLEFVAETPKSWRRFESAIR